MFGLIGKKLSHSFSKKYFTEKFQKLGLSPKDGYVYELFELDEIEDFQNLIKENSTSKSSSKLSLRGLNVTIPYKKPIIPFLDKLDPTAQKIGAVNTIKIENDGTKIGYNTDYIGFKNSLKKFLNINSTTFFEEKALVLGTGGAAQAVKVALEDLNIKFDFASSSITSSSKAIQENDFYKTLPYSKINIENYKLIINTTPLGMFPNIDDFPPLSEENYNKINEHYFLYDLVYNPEETAFLKKGKAKNAKIKSGLEMLHGQAEAAAKIWGISD